MNLGTRAYERYISHNKIQMEVISLIIYYMYFNPFYIDSFRNFVSISSDYFAFNEYVSVDLLILIYLF